MTYNARRIEALKLKWGGQDHTCPARTMCLHPQHLVQALNAAETDALLLPKAREIAGDCALTLLRVGSVHAPEDPEILALCERLGFGAVMDSASRQWLQRDADGAFTVGPCGRVVREAMEMGLANKEGA